MFPLKLLRSIVSGDDVTNNPLLLLAVHRDDSISPTNRVPLMLFVPTQELVRDTYRLASIARAAGMDFRPNPSLSHIIFSWPPPPTPPPPLRDNTVPIPFPSFATASLSNLRLFAALSRGYFKLAFLQKDRAPPEKAESLSNNNWHCSSLSLHFSRTGGRIESMDGFTEALLGVGWALFKTRGGDRKSRDFIYLYRKSDGIKVLGDGDCSRVVELRLPMLDFGNVALRILQYILLMTGDVFFLA